MLTKADSEILDIISKKKSYQDMFFKERGEIKWFHPLREKKYFEAVNNPSPQPAKEKGFFSIPYWNVLEYLEKVSLQTKIKENENYADDLLKIIHNVAKPKKGKKTDNYRTCSFFVKIMANLPTHKMSLNDIELIREFYDTKFDTMVVDSEITERLLPKFLNSTDSKDWEKAAKIFEIITILKEKLGRNKEKELKTFADSFWIIKFLNQQGELLTEKCFDSEVKILTSRIRALLGKKKEQDDRYSYIWLPSIDTPFKDGSWKEPLDFLILELGKTLLRRAKDTLKVTPILQELLKEAFEVFHRIAFFVIGKSYDSYSDIFWNHIKKEWFDTPNLRHELFILLRENFLKFDDNQKKKIFDVIEQVPLNLPKDGNKEENEKYVAIVRQRWLKALTDKGCKEADDLYLKYKKVTGADPEHPEFASYSYSGWGYTSPITSQDILKQDIELIVRYLQDFKQKGWGFKEPSESGLAETLRGAVKQNPEKFSGSLSQFLKIKLIYQCNIINGFADAWKENRDINWKDVLQHCQVLIQGDLWVNEETYENTKIRYREWVVTAIADLISTGLSKDERFFAPELMPLAEDILLIILKKQHSGMKDTKDALTQAINTTKGRAIEALIDYYLRYAKLAIASKKEKQNKKIQSVFQKAIKKQDDSLEYSVLIGQRMPLLYWIDKDLIVRNINSIFPKANPQHWNATMQGYLFGHKVYDELYKLVRKNNHYLKGIRDRFEDRAAQEHLIQHICIGYLRGFETLSGEGSLFNKLLQPWKENDIREIISFFWGCRDTEEEKIKNQIIKFWGYCYKKLSNKKRKSDDKILSDLNLLAVFLKDLKGDKKNWLLQSIPYVEANYHSAFILEYLDVLAEVSPKEVCDVFMTMLYDTVPYYKEENIKSIVDKLSAKGCKDCADKIRNIYVENGYKFLL